MELIFALVGLAAGLGSLVCWIWTIVVAFKEGDSPWLGVLCICGIVGFIVGWINHAAWGHTKVMAVWSVCFGVSLIAQIGMAATAGGAGY